MDTVALNRILELAYKWQDSLYWKQAFKAAADFRKYRDKNWKDGAVCSGMIQKCEEIDLSLKRKGLSAGDRKALKTELTEARKRVNGEVFEMFRHGSERHSELFEMSHRFVGECGGEFYELRNLVSQHVPAQLEFVPAPNSPNFFFDDPEADVRDLIKNLAKLEGYVRVMMAGTTPAPPLPGISHLGTTPADNEPHKSKATKPPLKGISLLDAAMLMNENDKAAASKTKKAWQDKRLKPNLPLPLGGSFRHSTMGLFAVSELLEFVAERGVIEVEDDHRGRLEMKLQLVKVTATKPSVNASVPSVKAKTHRKNL